MMEMMMQTLNSGEDVSKDQMMSMMQTMMTIMMDDGGNSRSAGGCSPSNGAVGSAPNMQQMMCSVHQKMRTVRNLVDDGQGGMVCMPGSECGAERAPPPMREGDWECPGCGDHQFARNTNCRKCNTPKPANIQNNAAASAFGGHGLGPSHMQGGASPLTGNNGMAAQGGPAGLFLAGNPVFSGRNFGANSGNSFGGNRFSPY